MDKLLLYGIVGTSTLKLPTSDYKELFPSDTYIPPPTKRNERRKHERELKKKSRMKKQIVLDEQDIK